MLCVIVLKLIMNHDLNKKNLKKKRYLWNSFLKPKASRSTSHLYGQDFQK